MTPEQQAAYVFAQAVCAFGEILHMDPGLTSSAKAQEVERIIGAYGIHHNAVLSIFHGR